MSNAAEIFAAMGEAIQGAEGKRLRRKFKVRVGALSCLGLEQFVRRLSGKLARGASAALSKSHQLTSNPRLRPYFLSFRIRREASSSSSLTRRRSIS